MSKDFASVAYGAINSSEAKIFVANSANETINFSKAKFIEIKAIVDEGNYSWRIGGLISGFVICTISFLSFFSHLFGLAPLTAVLDLYIFVGGLIAILLELKDRLFTQKYLDILKKEALFLYRPYGRAGFYFFIGILLACKGGILGTLGGIGVAFVGIIIYVGTNKAYKALNELKTQVFDRNTVIAKFDQFDKDKNGYLDTAELSSLCLSLGSLLSKNELESALFILDRDQDGKITRDEFLTWWEGKDDVV